MNRRMTGFILLIEASALFAQVNIRVMTGIVMRTTGNVQVRIEGDITEEGVFLGRLSSGARSSVTEFAGLTLGTGLEGCIVRTTDSTYHEGNGEGANLKRYYQVSNTGSPLTTTMSSIIRTSGLYDEQNGLSGPYYFYRYTSSAWNAFGSGSSDSPVTASDAVIPAGASDWIISEGIQVSARIFLQGSYDSETHQMTTMLGPGSGNVIPLTAPYADDARTCAAVPSTATEWIMVQLRSATRSSAIGSRSCFLRADGMLTTDDGTTTQIRIPAAPGDYYLVICHRNHLSVMSAAPVTGLTWGSSAPVYDFTTGTGQYYGSEAALLETDVYGLFAGDCNQDGGITITDHNQTMTDRNNEGYLSSDLNLDQNVTIRDNTLCKDNRNISTKVP